MISKEKAKENILDAMDNLGALPRGKHDLNYATQCMEHIRYLSETINELGYNVLESRQLPSKGHPIIKMNPQWSTHQRAVILLHPKENLETLRNELYNKINQTLRYFPERLRGDFYSPEHLNITGGTGSRESNFITKKSENTTKKNFKSLEITILKANPFKPIRHIQNKILNDGYFYQYRRMNFKDTQIF